MSTEASEHTNWPLQIASTVLSITPEPIPEILYVMGAGRSGTTILEVLLTNDEGITGTGELKHIFRDGFVRDLNALAESPGISASLWARVLHASGWNHAHCVTLGKVVEKVESHAHFPLVYLGLQGKSCPARLRASEHDLVPLCRTHHRQQSSRRFIEISRACLAAGAALSRSSKGLVYHSFSRRFDGGVSERERR